MTASTSRRPADLMELARRAYDTHLETLDRHGVSVDSGLRFVAGSTPEVYYAPDTMTINVGVADLDQPSGRMYWLFVARLLGVRSADAAVDAFASQLPLLVVHEIAHHLRHRYGAPITNDFIEEQVANTLAIAFLAEHPQYRGVVEALRGWAATASPALAAMVPGSASARTGFRLELGDVLVERGLVSRTRLEELRVLAEDLDRPLDDLIAAADVVTDDQIAGAEKTRMDAQDYFNRRYMADPTEYQSFHLEWYRAYLERAEFPSFAEALETHILTDDWERSRASEVRSMLVKALEDRNDDLAVSAAQVLASEVEEPSWLRVAAMLPDLRPAVAAALLRAAGRRGSSESDAVWLEAATQAMTSADPELRAASAAALASRGDREATAVLQSMLGEGGAESTWALRALQDHGTPELTEPLVALATRGASDARALALRALVRDPSASALEARLVALRDPEDEIREAAASSLCGTQDPEALKLLASALEDPCAAVRSTAGQALRAGGANAVPALRTVRGGWAARVEAVLALYETGDDEAVTAVSSLLEELLAASTALFASPERFPMTSPAVVSLVHTAMDQERQRVAMLAFRLALAVHHPEGSSVVLESLASADETVRRSASDLGLHVLPTELRDEITRLLHPPGPASPLTGPATSHEAWADYLEPWLSALVAEARNHSSNPPHERGARMLTSIEKLVFVRAVPIFHSVQVRDLRSMAEDFLPLQFSPGERVFDVGADDQCLYVVTSGVVVIEQDQPDGSTSLTAELGPGLTFGEAAMLEGRPRSARATARAETTLLALQREDFLRLARREPAVLVEVTRMLARQLREANADLG
jgi:CRP/FNR family cyclic AMP-dependent transcriptional regulator